MDIADMAVVPPEHARRAGVLVVTGDVIEPISITLDELKQHRSVTADPFDLRCFTSRRLIRTVDPYRGVLLTDLLTRAGLRSETPGDFKRMVFIAVAHDGYAVTFSWHELFNSPVGAKVIVAHACGEQALDASDGAPVLHSGADTFPAPRHVKRLERIVARILTP
jgi:hypothetical protein